MTVAWTPDELCAAAHRRSVRESPRPEMVITDVQVAADGDGLVVFVDALHPGGAVHRWTLGSRSMYADLRPLSLVAAAHILRATVEEWRDTRLQYPDGIPGMTEERLS